MPMTSGRLRAFFMHDFESIDDHVSEIGALALARDDLRNVIELLRIRQRQDAAFAGLHPDRLVVVTPIEQISVAGFLQEIGREVRLRDPGPEPPVRALSGMFLDRGGRFLDQQLLLVLGEFALTFGIAAAVPDNFGAGKCRDGCRRMVVHLRVHEQRNRQLQFRKQVGKAEDADAVAIVAPGVIEDVRLRSAGRQFGSRPSPNENHSRLSAI